MSRFGCNVRGVLILAMVCAAGWGSAVRDAVAVEVVLADGRILRGKPVPVSGLTEVAKAGVSEGVALRNILMIDDDLRRTFVAKRLVREVRQDDPGELVEKFVIWQKRPTGGRRVASIGPIRHIEEFDEYGRRIVAFNTPKGQVDVIQGITLITPEWTKVVGLNYGWDMRIATSSIHRDVLHKILMKRIDPKDVEHYKKLARFYLQCEGYAEARKALEATAAAFPRNPNIKQELEPTIRALRQMGAQRMLSLLRLRRDAGQNAYVLTMLENFPSEEVAGEILQAVRKMIGEYETVEAQKETVLKEIAAELGKIQDTALRAKLEPICREIAAELNAATLGRLTAFHHVVDDEDLLPVEKLSYAVSGWLLGSDAAMEKHLVSLSLYRVRGLVKQYLTEPLKMNRSQIIDRLKSEEGGVPGRVAGLIAHMKPPFEPPEPISEKQPGLYRLEVRGLPEQPPVPYLIQLPPEYDPYRRYPAIVTLHGSATTAAHQIDWWAGAASEDGRRNGQATHHGYVVIAPQWTVEHQRRYGYYEREHAAVLRSLRDACKRFSIDTDRVFLTGHSMGGDAAWDIGIAHPDLWAGVIPIVAQSDRYITHYSDNARQLPLYFVCGELDGAKMIDNARDLDRYLKSHTFNCTVVEYRGRGHEHFSDEILRIFDWMGRFRRNFFPRKFKCQTMRPWDNFFWNVEVEGLPAKSTVHPDDWPPPKGARASKVEGQILENNKVNVRAATNRVTVWLSPEIIDFQERTYIKVNGGRINNRAPFVEPDLPTLLEDVRTRGDRQHPFWAKVESSTGRVLGGR